MRILLGLFFGLTASISVLTASGCGSSPSDKATSPGDTTTSPDDQGSPGSTLPLISGFTDRAVQRVCAKVSACCSEANYPFDEAGCEAANSPKIVQFFAMQFMPGTDYDPAAGERCLDSIGTPELGCSAKADYKSENCQSVFVGSVPLGGKCSENEGCAPADGGKTSCEYPPSADWEHHPTGVCVLYSPPPPSSVQGGKAGEACSSTCFESGVCNTLCVAGKPCPTDLPTCYEADGLFCSESNICTPLGVAGDPCSDGLRCSAGTFCSLDGDIERCKPLLQAGEPCQDASQCETDYCAETCTSRPPVRVSAEFCLGHIPSAPTTH